MLSKIPFVVVKNLWISHLTSLVSSTHTRAHKHSQSQSLTCTYTHTHLHANTHTRTLSLMNDVCNTHLSICSKHKLALSFYSAHNFVRLTAAEQGLTSDKRSQRRGLLSTVRRPWLLWLEGSTHLHCLKGSGFISPLPLRACCVELYKTVNLFAFCHCQTRIILGKS